MRKIIFGVLFFTGCRSIDIQQEFMNNSDIARINSTLCNIREKSGEWPTQNQWDSLRSTDNRFSHIRKSDNKITGDTIVTQTRIEYDKYESSIKVIEVSQSLAFYDSGYSYSREAQLVDGKIQGGFGFGVLRAGCYSNNQRIIECELQTGIKLGSRTALNQSEKRSLKTWNKEVLIYRQSKFIVIEDLKSKKRREIHLNEKLGVFTKTDTLYPIKIKWDSVAKKYDFEETGDWFVTKVNSQANSITLTNYMNDETKTVQTEEIDHVIYVNKRQFRYNQIAGITFMGSLAWTAIGIKADQDETLNIAAITLSAASLVYLITVWRKTGEREYKVIKIVE